MRDNVPFIITKEQEEALRKLPRPNKEELERYSKLFKKIERKRTNMITNGTISYDRATQILTKKEFLVPQVEVKIKKLNDKAVIPTYGSEGAAGFDFYAVGDYIVDPGQTVIVKTGLAMAIPARFYLAVVPRSGVSAKTGIRIANAPGTVDCDYRGEIGVIVTNTGNDTFTIDEGYRIAQGVILPYYQADFKIVNELDETARGAGGFGSTGVK